MQVKSAGSRRDTQHEQRYGQFPAPMRHEPGIDGLRGYGVLMVALFHAGLTPDQTGAYTIGAFFVISGFLISRLTVAQWAQSGEMRPGTFLTQRLIRLYPTLLVTVALTTAWVWWLGPLSGRPELLGNAATALTHTFNFHLLNSDAAGYGRLFTARSPWSHLWSVSIEEQFYLIFAPVTAYVFAKYGAKRPAATLTKTFGWMALGFMVAQIVVVSVTSSPVIAYLRTDSRASEFLIGALLGVLYARDAFAWWRGPLLSWLGFLLLAAVTVSWYTVPREAVGSYLGGLQLHAVFIGGIALAACTEGPFKRAIGNRVLVRLGKWSYAVYLFHWPAIVMLQHWRRSASPTVALVAIAISIAAAGVVTEFLEQPVRSLGRRKPAAVLGGLAAIAAVLVGAAFALNSSWQYAQRVNPPTDGRKADMPDPSPTDPRPRVVMVSDSVGNVILGSMARIQPSTVWVNRVQSGCVLTKDPIWWIGGWQDRSGGSCPTIIKQVASYLRPMDTAIFGFGNGDSRERKHGDDAISVETFEGRRIVKAEIRSYLRSLAASGARVVALNIGPSLSYEATGVESVTPTQARAWNDALAEVVRDDFPEVSIVELNELLSNDYAPVEKRGDCVLRGTDGFHLSQCGGDLAARMVLKTLNR